MLSLWFFVVFIPILSRCPLESQVVTILQCCPIEGQVVTIMSCHVAYYKVLILSHCPACDYGGVVEGTGQRYRLNNSQPSQPLLLFEKFIIFIKQFLAFNDYFTFLLSRQITNTAGTFSHKCIINQIKMSTNFITKQIRFIDFSLLHFCTIKYN